MRVWAYRNLKRGGYSLMVRGRVVAWRRRLLLRNARFVVRPGGHARVLRERRKNVHAFVVGDVVRSAFGTHANTKIDLPARITYNPYKAASFLCGPYPVKGARAVLLNERGCSACYVEI